MKENISFSVSLYFLIFSDRQIVSTTPLPLRNMAGFLFVTEQKNGFMVATLEFVLFLNTKFDKKGTKNPIIFPKSGTRDVTPS